MFASVARFPLGLWDISGNALIAESLGSMAEKAHSSTFHMKFQVQMFLFASKVESRSQFSYQSSFSS
jgi:hypothetical protein